MESIIKNQGDAHELIGHQWGLFPGRGQVVVEDVAIFSYGMEWDGFAAPPASWRLVSGCRNAYSMLLFCARKQIAHATRRRLF